jgi:hypothetical protein
MNELLNLFEVKHRHALTKPLSISDRGFYFLNYANNSINQPPTFGTINHKIAKAFTQPPNPSTKNARQSK